MQANVSPISPSSLRLHILLVEERHAGQTLLERMLTRLSHIVVQANNGNEALPKFRVEKFDLVLLDVKTADFDAVAGVIAMRSHEDEAGRYTAMIGMATTPNQEDRKHCLAAGMDRYTSKPINVTELQTIFLAFSNPDKVVQMVRPAEWSRASLLERSGGNERSLKHLMKVFAKEKPNLLAEMDRALQAKEAERLERTALKLEQDLAYMGALELAQAAHRLALLGKDSDFLSAGSLLPGLHSRLDEMDTIMRRRGA